MPVAFPPLMNFALLRSNREMAFWTLNTAFWAAYWVTQYFGTLMYEKAASYGPVLDLAAVVGLIITVPMRFMYRRLWGGPPRSILASALVICFIMALLWRTLINLSFSYFVHPGWHFKSLFELFGGTVSSAYLLMWWSALYFGSRYYESQQRQQEAMFKALALAQQAQLKMLRYQLNPHFLFNTLNAISTLILDNQNRTASHAIARLSEFLRYTLDQDPMKKVTLRQEIEMLDLYLGTERLRFGERLHLEYAIEDEALAALVPSLLLQPLLENALKYAISPRAQGGVIRIEARARPPMLEISVVDDGPGLKDGALQGERWGVGLRNTRERLEVLYGQSYRFAVLNSRPGVRVELALPLETAVAEDRDRSLAGPPAPPHRPVVTLT
jgi:two-component system, LytTR family, sensor kinase